MKILILRHSITILLVSCFSLLYAQNNIKHTTPIATNSGLENVTIGIGAGVATPVIAMSFV